MTLSVVIITYNSADVMEGALKSIAGMWDELLVGDGGSRNGTLAILKKYQKGKNGFRIPSERLRVNESGMTKTNLGKRKQELVEKAKGDWILVLDADERVSEELAKEIGRVGEGRMGREYVAYRIPYQNYVFGRPVYYGGERYAKVRLFRRGHARVSPEPLHEEVIIKNGNVGELKGVIHHYSYRTPWQLFTKFTRYAWTAAGMLAEKREKVTLRKLFLYGPHMFWARYIKEKGYKDGWRGQALALAFGYMEGLTYWLIFTRPPLAKAKGVAFKTP